MGAQTPPAFQVGQQVKHVSHGVGEVIDPSNEMELYGIKQVYVVVQIGTATHRIPHRNVRDLLVPMSLEAQWDRALVVLSQEPKSLFPWMKAVRTLTERLERGTPFDFCQIIRDTAIRAPVIRPSLRRIEFFEVACTRLIEEYQVVFKIGTVAEACSKLQSYCAPNLQLGRGVRRSMQTMSLKRESPTLKF